ARAAPDPQRRKIPGRLRTLRARARDHRRRPRRARHARAERRDVRGWHRPPTLDLAHDAGVPARGRPLAAAAPPRRSADRAALARRDPCTDPAEHGLGERGRPERPRARPPSLPAPGGYATEVIVAWRMVSRHWPSVSRRHTSVKRLRTVLPAL